MLGLTLLKKLTKFSSMLLKIWKKKTKNSNKFIIKLIETLKIKLRQVELLKNSRTSLKKSMLLLVTWKDPCLRSEEAFNFSRDKLLSEILNLFLLQLNWKIHFQLELKLNKSKVWLTDGFKVAKQS